eukprot:TRINITY_DN5311_c0_g1_i1.p1 TRINITY_DN5311_c0_g1~~TRINITY_DN5311_c0_g1_i1.p1  ORF type:complete len:1263 (-),score=380.06 TRINITY_DN5311_c0_g1_i1:95-3883(-)
MHPKFETKSNRVKGLSFHPTRPWILASLHNGVIQLWDYRIKTLIDKFDEHLGPVRGICFHGTQPLFVSGGDDYRIKVWNYKKRRCLFTLLGHLDYIRTVQFHPGELPWILSSSDDQTIRIWNWQSRGCLAVLTGHNHYVMCAAFHPKEDLVVSASLDQTVRVWDISGLRKKTVSPKSFGESEAQRLQADLFGGTDAIVKFVLEGHDRGVNWVAFHPTMPFIVSGADDRLVKLWRMNDSKAWEVDTFRGHFNNVSCVLFHPKYELVISNSEDKTIRVWDLNKRAGIQTFRRENDRFWILAAHPTQNVLAAGHDSGLVMFKLVSERPAYTTSASQLVYVSNGVLRAYDFASARDVPLMPLKKNSSGPLSAHPGSLSFSPADNAILVYYKGDGGHYELYQLAKDGRSSESSECKRGSGVNGAVFVGRKRFCVLDKSKLVVKDLSNTEIKRIVPALPMDQIFQGPIVGTLLLRSDEKIILYDLQQKKAMAELAVSGVRYVVWSYSPVMRVALIAKDSIVIASKNLEQLATVHEIIRIKSGAWDEHGVFIYSTLSHLKYLLPNGDSGIVRTLEIPVYITALRGNRVFCLDRECKNRVITVNPTEYLFKLALVQKRYADVLAMVQHANLVGQAIIAYLQNKGYADIALQFVRDERTRFGLALECGNIEVALEAAKVINDKDCWQRLGAAALRQGNHQVVELAYQRTKDFARLSFLYLITGNTEKLEKMLSIADKRGDVEGRFHNALYLGAARERAAVLLQSGFPQLAYVVAQAHGIDDLASQIAEQLVGADGDKSTLPTLKAEPKLLVPPIPVMRAYDSNWPLLTVSKGWQDALQQVTDDNKFAAATPEEEQPQGAWAEGASLPDELGAGAIAGEDAAAALGAEAALGEGSAWDQEAKLPEASPAPAAGEGDGWAIEAIEGLDAIPDEPVAAANSGARGKGEKGFYVPPTPGVPTGEIWCRNSQLAADHAAAGSFLTAMRLLNKQVGVVNFAPLRPLFLQLYMGSQVSLPCVSALAGLPSALQRNAQELASTPTGRMAGLPALCVAPGVAPLAERLKAAYNCFTKGAFADALLQFQTILVSVLLASANSRAEADELKELVVICREYSTGIQLELKRKEMQSQGGDIGRQLELAAYFTHSNLQLFHLTLVLRSAMTCAAQHKNYLNALSFARRLLELNPKPEFVNLAEKVCRLADANKSNALKINYDERNPFTMCCGSFTPIYRGSLSVLCPYCKASYLPQYNGTICTVCLLAAVGQTNVTGLNTGAPE